MPPLFRQLSNVGNRFFTTTGYINIEYLLKGSPDADTVVLLHGTGLGSRIFLPNIDALASDFQVLAISLRGHGLSDPPQEENFNTYTIPQMLRDIIELTWSLGIQEFHLVGNSLGGMIGYELLKSDPFSLLSLTTFGAPATFENLGLSEQISGQVINVAGRLRGRKKQAQMMARQLSDNPETVSFLVDEIFPTTNWDSLKFIRQARNDQDYLAELRQCDMPLLMIWGQDDYLIKQPSSRKGMKETRDIIRGNENGRVEEIPHAGNLANLDQPAKFNEILLSFLREVR